MVEEVVGGFPFALLHPEIGHATEQVKFFGVHSFELFLQIFEFFE